MSLSNKIIPLVAAFFVGSCGGGSGSPNSLQTGGGRFSFDDQTASRFSCGGARIWGPITQDSRDTLFYISEPSDITDPSGADVPRCLLFWEYNPTQGCSLAFPLDGAVNVQVLNNGDAVATDTSDGITFQLPPAGISVIDLASLPDCFASVSQ